MNSGQKPRTTDRITAIFRRPSSNRNQPPSASRKEDLEVPTATPASDKERTRERYLKAVSLLEDVLKGRNEKWGNFEIPKLEGELDDVDPAGFRDKIEGLCQLYSQKRNRNALEQCAHVVECCFTAFRPFAKNFLSIARESAQVCALVNFYLLARYLCSTPTDCFLEASLC
jgi:hypothetical protein